MNPLSNSPTLRRRIYAGLWLVGLVLTAAQVWVGATDAGQPKWLTGALAVFPAVAAYVGYQAQANTEPEAPAVSPERLQPIVPAEPLDGPNEDYDNGKPA